MADAPIPPETYQAFVQRFPKVAQGWQALAEAGREGPLDERTVRLALLALAMGALREGAVHASVRKALAAGIRREEIEQLIALAAGTLGLPATVAVYSWVREQIDAAGGA
jgi:alkylhydroperoxidase/carboxymuconolactone decarboxylase family protein YurZ